MIAASKAAAGETDRPNVRAGDNPIVGRETEAAVCAQAAPRQG